MSATHTMPFAGEKPKTGFFRRFVNYLGFLAATYAVARAWSAHLPADERDLERAGMTRLQDQVLSLHY